MANIVLIEDSRPITFLIEAILETQHHVAAYGNGEQGLAALRSAPPDLLILDVGLPDVSGFELATQIRREISLTDLPILMLTALGDVDNRVRGLRVADDYLTKPFDKNELLARVEALLRRKRDVGAVRGRLELLGGAGAAVQLVALLHPQGALVFDDGAVVYFAQGRIIDVHHPRHPRSPQHPSPQQGNNTAPSTANTTNNTANNTASSDALMTLLADTLTRSEGGFRFEPQAPLPPATLNLDPMAVLLEVTRLADEATHNAANTSSKSRNVTASNVDNVLQNASQQNLGRASDALQGLGRASDALQGLGRASDVLTKRLIVVPDLLLAVLLLEQLHGKQTFVAREHHDQQQQNAFVIFEGETTVIIALHSKLQGIPKALSEIIKAPTL